MADAETSEKLMASLVIGSEVAWLDDSGMPRMSELLEIHPYHVIVRGLANKVLVPVQRLEQYEKVDEEMARSPTGAGRGRPRKDATETQAPIDVTAGRVLLQGGHPQASTGQQVVIGYMTPDNVWIGAQSGTVPPPGSRPVLGEPTQPGLAQPGQMAAPAPSPVYQPQPAPGVVGMPPGVAMLGNPAAPAATPVVFSAPQGNAAPGVVGQPAAVPVAQAEGDADWLQTSLEEAIDDLREHVMTILQAATAESEEDASKINATAKPASGNKTCNMCINADMRSGMCVAFQCNPPIFVVLDAKNRCDRFVEIDDDIPF